MGENNCFLQDSLSHREWATQGTGGVASKSLLLLYIQAKWQDPRVSSLINRNTEQIQIHHKVPSQNVKQDHTRKDSRKSKRCIHTAHYSKISLGARARVQYTPFPPVNVVIPPHTHRHMPIHISISIAKEKQSKGKETLVPVHLSGCIHPSSHDPSKRKRQVKSEEFLRIDLES